MNEKQALEYSIKIWEPVPLSHAEKEIRANELGDFFNHCPLCHLFIELFCIDCPLSDAEENCIFDNNSAWKNWNNAAKDENYDAATKYGNLIAQICKDRLSEIEEGEK